MSYEKYRFSSMIVKEHTFKVPLNYEDDQSSQINVFVREIIKEDLKEIGKFKSINYSPKGLFPENLKSFY